MEDLKNKNINELYQEIDKILYFLSTNNKNYTKKQFNNILNLIDIIVELKDR